jgi:hypothetical protein
MNKSTIFPPNDALIEEMYAAVYEQVKRSLSPIGISDPKTGQIVQHGTGTLFAVGQDYFLVSASHVFGDAVGHDRIIYAYDFGEVNEHGTKMIAVQLDGKIYRYEEADLGILRMTEESARKFTQRSFLRLHDVRPKPAFPGWAYIYGFPREYVKEGPDATNFYNPLNMAAAISLQEPPGVHGFDPVLHFVLDTSRERMSRTDGEVVQLPDNLGGISGCPVWQTWWPGEDESSYWRTKRVRIVGIQTGAYTRGIYKTKGPLIKASKFEGVLLLIYKSNEALLPVIDMHFPNAINPMLAR